MNGRKITEQGDSLSFGAIGEGFSTKGELSNFIIDQKFNEAYSPHAKIFFDFFGMKNILYVFGKKSFQMILSENIMIIKSECLCLAWRSQDLIFFRKT